MADKTLGFKISEEVYEKAKATIDTSGLTAKDWLEKALVLYEINSLKDGISGDFSNDLSELEAHTTRIYTLISNMIARSTYLKDHAVKEVADKLESKEVIITQYQEEIKALKVQLATATEQHLEAQDKSILLEEQLGSMQKSLDNNQDLINEYKEKNDTLSGLVTEYRGYAKDNETLKEDLANTRFELTERAQKAEQDREQLAQKLRLTEEQLNQKLAHADEQLQQTIAQHQSSLENLTEKKDIEREKALVSLQKSQQEQLSSENEKVRSLYDEIAQLRTEHEQHIQELKQDFEKRLNNLKK